MLLAGDEFCRTQKGNNNAYCHDNASTWVDWNLLEKNPEVYEFAKMLIRFRTQCPLYDREEALTGMDTRGVGAPGVSGHGIEPWEVNVSYYSREIGILFYGTYYGGASIYMIFNFHWDAHELFDTGQDTDAEKKSGIKQYVVSPRSVVVFESEK